MTARAAQRSRDDDRVRGGSLVRRPAHVPQQTATLDLVCRLHVARPCTLGLRSGLHVWMSKGTMRTTGLGWRRWTPVVAITLALALVCDVIFGGTTAAIVAGLVGVSFAWFWFALPLARLVQGKRSH